MSSSYNIQLSTMSFDEKIALMEELWRDLSADPESLPSPEWHKRVLEERDAAVKAGDTDYEDWESAKERLLRLAK